MEQLDLFHGEQVAFVPQLIVVLTWREGVLWAEWSGWRDGGSDLRQRFSSWPLALASVCDPKNADVRVKVR